MLRPAEAQPRRAAVLPHCSHPTDTRFGARTAAAILTTGRRTAANALRAVGDRAPGPDASDRRVLSSAEWSGLELGCAPTRFRLGHVVPDGPVARVGGDAVDGPPGRTVPGNGRHRDPVRSSHSHTARRYGHQWVALAVWVTFPCAARRWARPVLGDLYRPPRSARRRASGTGRPPS